MEAVDSEINTKRNLIMKAHLFLTLSIAVFLSSVPAVAQDNELDTLLAMDLSELATVSIASKREETVDEAPGIINVITADDIKTYGANNLMDVFRHLPALFPLSMYILPNNVSSIRGQSAGSQDVRVLILIDGRPMREYWAGGINSPIYESFPISAIEQIEVIRGPGSVLYGTNAFSGVINIKTKHADKNNPNGGTVALTYGSFETFAQEGHYSRAFEDGYISISGKHSDINGWDYKASDVAGIYAEDKFGNEEYGFHSRLNYKGFTLSAVSVKIDHDILGIAPTWPISDYPIDRHMVDLQYKHEMWRDWELTLNTTLQWNNFRSGDRLVDTSGNNQTYEGSISGLLTDNINLLIGGSYTHLKGDDKAISHPANPNITSSSTWKSAYTQLDYKLTKRHKLVGGVQYNYIGNSIDDFTPRLGIISNWGSGWGSKILYGEAFRAPYKSELAVNIPGVAIGDPSLKSETVTTADLQVFHRNETHYAALTLYKSKQEDTIFLDNGLFQNGGEVDYHGAELEVEYKLSDELSLQGSYSYQRNKTGAGAKDQKLAPTHMAKLGIDYQIHEAVRLGIFDSYFSSPKPREEINPGILNVNPNEKSFHYLTANIDIDVAELFSLPNFQGVKFSLYGDNLLENDTVYYPDTIAPVNTLPQWSGRALYARLSMEF